jgi:uroporphyrinogen III methyltransferase/synthase
MAYTGLQRPLAGKRIAVTRAEEQASELAARLEALGAEAVVCPTIAIAPPVDFALLDQAIAQLAESAYDWIIFTSANGVRALLDRMGTLGYDTGVLQHCRLGAIGPATARALAKRGLTAGFVPSVYVAEAIVAEIGDIAGQRILLPRADGAREMLTAGLRARGALVDEVAAYRTVPGPGIGRLRELLQARALHAITFTSSSTVRYLLDGLAAAGLRDAEVVELVNHTAIACIGPITAETARRAGLRVDVVASRYTTEGLVEALVAHFVGAVSVEST